MSRAPGDFELLYWLSKPANFGRVAYRTTVDGARWSIRGLQKDGESVYFMSFFEAIAAAFEADKQEVSMEQ